MGSEARRNFHVPMQWDEMPFEDRYFSSFGQEFDDTFADMEMGMDTWRNQFHSIVNNSCKLEPSTESSNGKREERLSSESSEPTGCYTKDPVGQRRFQQQFIVKDFKPEEVSVVTDDGHLIVSAKHEESGGERSEVREFNRRMKLPSDVKQETLTSSYSVDGVLTVGAEVTPSANDLSSSQGDAPRYRSSLYQATPAFSHTDVYETPPEHSASSSGADKIQTFHFQLPATGILANEVKITTEGGKVIVSGKHAQDTEHGQEIVSFSKQYLLPRGTVKEKMAAYIKDGQYLVIEAPIHREKLERVTPPQKQPLNIEHN